MEYLHYLDSINASPLLTAFILGLLINISPCPLCTNITAISFLGKDIGNKSKILRNSLLYILGKTISYTGLAIVLYFTANLLSVQSFFETYGEKILGPVLIITGILLSDVIKFHKHDENCNHKHFSPKKSYRLGAFWLGIAFALAFCPYSGVIYFGMLIPMSITSPSGLLLPLLFSIGSVLPAIFIAWILAYGVSGIAKMQDKLNAFDLWFRRITAFLFIVIGLYLCYENFFCIHEHLH